MQERPDKIQDLFFKKPVLSILLLSMLLTLPWIGVSDFYTKGEPREASLVVSMINDGNWILPKGYADEIAYKPPLMHWIIAGFSQITGHVSEATSRLPSALGLIGITMFTLVFLIRRKTKVEAVLSALILLTCFEMHRNGIEARVDMTLAFFMSVALIEMFRWEEKGLRGFPVLLVILLGCATLVKGPVGVILPCFVFSIYLLVLKYPFGKVFLKNIIVAIPALFILFIWYFVAWNQEGRHFLTIVFAENIGRFFGMKSDALGINYDLGHEGPFWYYIPAILAGLLPWSLILLFALFTFDYKKWWKNVKEQRYLWFRRFASIDKITLFSIITILVFLCFYSIPISKRSVYILPIYPFASFLLARVILWVEKVRPSLIHLLSNILLTLVALILLLTCLAHFINISDIVAPFVTSLKTSYDVALFAKYFQNPKWSDFVLWFILLVVFILILNRQRTKNGRILIFSIFILFISLQVFLEGTAYPVFKNGHSVKHFASELSATFNLKNDAYVVNDLRFYGNLYGLNFYLGNVFKNFEKELPSHGYLIIGEKDLPVLRKKYTGRYSFVETKRTNCPYYNEMDDEVIVCKIIKF
jgi:4-amino-4-deoxy-L-arabinose transferase-like glycosyltransferase